MKEYTLGEGYAWHDHLYDIVLYKKKPIFQCSINDRVRLSDDRVDLIGKKIQLIARIIE